ncbi:MAG: CPBP family intramembrane metalloprotease [Elusimicrobia bacterium]|nr:CPBP family intramembrane metalloprotease [Elusimicrobiota bacterium]
MRRTLPLCVLLFAAWPAAAQVRTAPAAARGGGSYGAVGRPGDSGLFPSDPVNPIPTVSLIPVLGAVGRTPAPAWHQAPGAEVLPALPSPLVHGPAENPATPPAPHASDAAPAADHQGPAAVSGAASDPSQAKDLDAAKTIGSAGLLAAPSVSGASVPLPLPTGSGLAVRLAILRADTVAGAKLGAKVDDGWAGRRLFDGDIGGTGRALDAVPTQASPAAGEGPRLGPAAEGPSPKPRQTEPGPASWPAWKRYGVLSGLLGALAFVPTMLNATPFQTLAGVAQPALAHGPLSMLIPTLGIFPNYLVMALAAIALGVGGLPLRMLAFKLSGWEMRSMPDSGDHLLRSPPWQVVPKLVFGAAVEELTFRGLLLPLAVLFLVPWMPQIPAFALGSFLVSLVFSLIHGYGSVWTRVVGGMLYSGAFAVSGTLFFPILMHLSFNLTVYFKERRARAAT